MRSNFFITDNSDYDAIPRRIGIIAWGVFTGLLRYADPQGLCFPKVETLAEDLCISSKSVQRALKTLKDEGLIAVKKTRIGNIYTLLNRTPTDSQSFPKPIPTDSQSCSNGLTVPSPTDSQSPASFKQNTVEQDPVNKTAAAVASDEPDVVVTPDLGEVISPSKKAVEKALETKRLRADFERWYAAYPKKRNRADAEKAYLSLHPDPGLVDCLLKSVQQTIERARADPNHSWRREAGQYIPYPATWLHKRAWEDSDGIDTAALGFNPQTETVLPTPGLRRVPVQPRTEKESIEIERQALRAMMGELRHGH